MSLPAIDLAVFHENGYVHKQCRVTSLWFWTTDAERDTCGDTSEDEYTFIGAPLISGFDQRGKALKDAMREAFLGYFETQEHTRIDPIRYWQDGATTFTSRLLPSLIFNPMSPPVPSIHLPILWPYLSRAFV